jgi:hypothetical protein
MTDPQHPDVPLEPSSPETPAVPDAPGAPSPVPPAAATPDDSPTAAWPSLGTPTGGPDMADRPLAATPTESAPGAPGAPWEPAAGVPANRVDRVADGGTFGAVGTGPTDGRGRRLRWIAAIAGVAVVVAISIAVASLIGGKPATSTAMGYMPADVVTYSEFRLDLPGDQRQKLASFMKPIPGFDDSSQFDTKLNELFDRIVLLASNDEQTWTKDIAPWFGGQIALGMSIPTSSVAVSSSSTGLYVVTIKDRAKAIAWIQGIAKDATFNRSTYGDADLLIPTAGDGVFAIAVNDKVAILGATGAVKAAIDTEGKGAWTGNDDVEAALATVDRDYVMVGVTRVKAMADAFTALMAQQSPGALDRTQLDETILGMLPAWFANTGRFENDAFVTTSVGPAGNIGYDTSNHADGIVGHIPASTLLVTSEHDVGPSLTALIAKFRPLPEASDFFRQFDQAMSLLGGTDAVVGWWGDSAIVVSKLDDGTIGGGLVVKPRDAAAADRLLTSLSGFVALGGGSAGVTTRTADHNGTKVTIVDAGAAAGMTGLPPGYKAEIAWASNADIAVVGYGESFVNAVLDAGPGHSLADDARFKGLLDRAGNENIAVTFVDLKTIRTLLEPVVQATAPADAWEQYTKYIQPYLGPIDALIATGRKDGSKDRGVTLITTPR